VNKRLTATDQDFAYLDSPVKGHIYQTTLKTINKLSQGQTYDFFNQWHHFSKAVLDLLAICAWRADSDKEKVNIIKNLYSELGLDVPGGKTHPQLLEELIIEATGKAPETKKVSATTENFVNQITKEASSRSSSFSIGLLLGLEQVAYDILEVIKEVLVKSDQPQLVKHPYITIHEEIEAQHIDCTEENLANATDRLEAKVGYDFVIEEWREFWGVIYQTLKEEA